MDLAVIILNWNDATTTVSCVNSLRKWHGIAAEILVVDNGSDDHNLARLREELPGICLLRSDHNRGFSGGNNLAFDETLRQGDHPVLLLNSDAVIEEEDVLTLLRALNASPDVGVVCPVLREIGADETYTCSGNRNYGMNTHTRIVVRGDEESGELKYVDCVPGTIALFRAAALREVGPFDETYFFSGEIPDWCERARRMGFLSAVALEATGYHYHDKPDDRRATLYLYYGLRNRFLYSRKFLGRGRVLFWFCYSLLIAAYHLYRRRPASARAALLAALHGAGGKFGDQNHRFGR